VNCKAIAMRLNKNKLLFYTYNYVPFFKWYVHKKGLRILFYHSINVVQNAYMFENGMSLDIFRKQLDYFMRRYTIISLTEAINRYENGTSLSNCLCITFDDGFAECYTHIFPELTKRKLPATFFLIAETLNNKNLMWRNKLLVLSNVLESSKIRELIQIMNEEFQMQQIKGDLLEISYDWPMAKKDIMANFLWEQSGMESMQAYLDKNKPYLTDNQILEMIDGGMEIGNHTKSHPLCSRLSKEEIAEEIILSNKRLSEKYGVNILALSYPFGDRMGLEYETYVAENSTLKALLGIRNPLNNGHPKSWERCDMEQDYYKAMNRFYVRALYKYLGSKTLRLDFFA